MKIKDVTTGQVYDAEPVTEGMADVELDSPSGDKVTMHLEVGAVILTDEAGLRTVIHATQLGGQFVEVSNE